MRTGTALAILFLLLVPTMAAAQFDDPEPLTVSLSPQYPNPYGSVTVTPLSSSLNLANATMTLVVNGKKIYSGSARSENVGVGAAGALTTIQVTVTSGSASYTKTVSVRPEDLALVVEPVSSAPPLYPGKPLVPLEGTARIVAAASFKNSAGKALDPAALSYAWVVDGTLLADASGIGKTTLVIDSPLQYRSRTVSVEVQSQDGAYASSASIDIQANEPVVRIYESDPLLGIRFERALAGTFSISGSEASLFAAPFSFPKNTAPNLQWFLDGNPAQQGSIITMRPSGSGKGSSSLSFVASGGQFTTATVQLNVSYGSSSTGFFGL